MGATLGVNYFDRKTNHSATIQDAVNWVMQVPPRGENVMELCPHVAAVRAAYGDPSGKYLTYLRTQCPDFRKQPYWFYNQPSALRVRSNTASRSTTKARRAADDSEDFQCPDVFELAPQVELDYGVFVTCDQLRPLYLATRPDYTLDGSRRGVLPVPADAFMPSV